MSYRFFRRPSLVLGGIFVIGSLLAVACGGAEPTATATVAPTATKAPVIATVTPTSTPIPTPTATLTPKRGGVVKASIGQDPNTFDTLAHASGGTNTHLARLFSNLIWNPQGRILEPDAAESYTITDNGLTWVFKLRNNIKWNPGTPAGPRDGTLMTAADAKYSLEKMMGKAGSAAGGASARCGWIKDFVDTARPDNGVEVVDGLTVKVHLKQPFGSLAGVLSIGFCGLIPEGTTAAQAKQRPFGSGPFVLSSFERGARWVYARNPDYFKPGLPYLDEIQLLVITSTDATQAAFLTGRVDVSSGLPTKDNLSKYQEMIAQGKTRTLPYDSQCRPSGVFMNATRPPFNDINLRKAVNLALDRKAYAQVVFNGNATPHLFLDTGGFGRSVDEISKLPGYRQPHAADVEEAQRLVKAAYPNGLDIKIPTENSATYTLQGEYVANELNAIGIRGTLDMGDSTRTDAVMASLDFALFAYYFCQSTGVPEELFGNFFVTKAPRNWFAYTNPKLDAAYLDMAATSDPAQQKKKAQAMEDMLLEDMIIAPLPVQLGNRHAWSYVHDLPITISQYNWSKDERLWRDPS